jgi:hypothetical protein
MAKRWQRDVPTPCELVTPAKAGVQPRPEKSGMPAFAGMTIVSTNAGTDPPTVSLRIGPVP